MLTLSGTDTLAHYQQVLDSATFANSTNHDPTSGGTATTRTVAWAVTDVYGKTSTTRNTTLTITAVNDAPVVTVPGAQSFADANTHAVSGISVADPDADSGTVTVDVNDGGNTGPGGTLSDSKTVAVTLMQKPLLPVRGAAQPGDNGQRRHLQSQPSHDAYPGSAGDTYFSVAYLHTFRKKFCASPPIPRHDFPPDDSGSDFGEAASGIKNAAKRLTYRRNFWLWGQAMAESDIRWWWRFDIAVTRPKSVSAVVRHLRFRSATPVA